MSNMKLIDRVRQYYNQYDGCAILIAFNISEDIGIIKYSDEFFPLYNKIKVYAWRIKKSSEKNPGKVTKNVTPGEGNMLLEPGVTKNVTSPGIEKKSKPRSLLEFPKYREIVEQSIVRRRKDDN